MKVVKGNFENVKEFQSIQNLNEVLISICVENVAKSEAKLDQAPELIIKSITELQGEPFTFDGSLDPVALLLNVVASFAAFESYGATGDAVDKSTNAHNCRKSALLSQMFAVHKLISVLKADSSLSIYIL